MRVLWVGCLVGATLASSLPGAPPAQPSSADGRTEELHRLFAQLGSEDFAVRQHAERELYERGPSAISALEAAALTGKLGIVPHVLKVLERLLIDGCPDVADDAERALERLAFSERAETMGRARSVLSGNTHRRRQRAIAAIHGLEGRVAFESIDGAQPGNAIWAWGGEPQLAIPGQSFVRMNAFLLRDWQGGEEGLWHVTRLEDDWSARLWGMDVTSVRGSGVSFETVQTLAARIPHLRVQERGASLGIRGGATGDCEVTEVVPGGAADEAGLQRGDVVRRLNEIPIEKFGDLIGNLLDFTPGDNVTLTVKRGVQEFELPVVLGGWRDLSIASRRRGPTPQFNKR